MQRGLYDLTLVTIFRDIIDGKILLESLQDELPTDIIDDIESYIMLSPMKRFYKSIKDRRNITLVRFFMDRLHNHGKSPIISHGLFLAAKTNNFPVIKLLFPEDPQSGPFLTTILAAVKNGNNEIAKILLKDYRTYSYEDDLILGAAIRSGNNDLINQFFPITTNYSPALVAAVQLQDQKLIDSFLEKRITPEGIVQALKMAIKVENRTLINFFLDKISDNWMLPLEAAVGKSDIELVNLILRKGADYFTTHPWLNYALYAAIEVRNTNLINYFIDQGANDMEGALEISARIGDVELVKQFKALVPVEEWKTPLLLAINNGQFHIIDELIPEMSESTDIQAFGPVISYFVQNAFLTTESGMRKEIDVGELLPLAKQGYMKRETTSYCFIIDGSRNGNLERFNRTFINPNDLIVEIFGAMQALYFLSATDPLVKEFNDRGLTSFDIYPRYRAGFDLLGLDELININMYERKDMDQGIINTLNKPEIIKQAWKEYHIMAAVVVV